MLPTSTIFIKENTPRTKSILQKWILQNNDNQRIDENLLFSNLSLQDENYALIFQGEILNRLDFSKGESLTDQEMFIRLIQTKGLSVLEKIEGNWSFILYDKLKKKLYVGGDHFGNRKIWFLNSEHHFGIATRGKILLDWDEAVEKIDKEAVMDYLIWGEIGKRDQHFYKNIHQLKPGTFLEYDIVEGQFEIHKYYELISKNARVVRPKSNEETIADLRNYLSSSISRNIEYYNSTIAVGLSGGLDSSSIVALAKNQFPNKHLVAFTTTNNYDGGEVEWAEKVIQHTKVDWVKVDCTAEQLQNSISTINDIHDAPVFNASTFTQYRIMEEVGKQNIRCILDGQGGDELFLGYAEHYVAFLKALFRQGHWGRELLEFLYAGNSSLSSKDIFIRFLKGYAKNILYSPQKIAQTKRKLLLEGLNKNATNSFFLTDIPKTKYSSFEEKFTASFQQEFPNLISWSVVSAEAHGIDNKMPFANDRSLIEWAFSVPMTQKIQGGWSKYLLRKAVEDILPPEVVWRKDKKGFYFPEDSWLKSLEQEMKTIIQEKEDPLECINKQEILSSWDRNFSNGELKYRQFIFRCYSYLIWVNQL